MKSKISVIVPSYNSHKTIQYTLDHLLSQDGNFIKEIIVVDSSDDGKTKTIIDRYDDKIVILNLNDKTIPAVGRNKGAEVAKGEILAFIDSDAFPAPDWSKEIMAGHESGIFVGGGAYNIPDKQKLSPLALAQFFLQFSEFFQIGSQGKREFVPSCNLYCDKKVFFQSGGFPEIRAMEDVQFGRNVNKIKELEFLPRLIVYHIFRESYSLYFKNQYMLGKYNRISRDFCLKNKYLSLLFSYLLFPIFYISKLSLVSCRVVKMTGKDVLLFLYSLPIFMAGVFCWTLGFVNGGVGESESEN